MDVLMVTAELSPYATATDTGETVASLSKALRQLGHEVTIATPRVRGFEEAGMLMARRLTPLELEGGPAVTVLDGQLSTGAKIVAFDVPDLFDRDGVFEGTEGPYTDNAQRFGLLCRAAGALVEQRKEQGAPFGVVHLHDWPAAPFAVAARASGDVPTVLTVYDTGRQGRFDAEGVRDLGFPERWLAGDTLLLDGELNFLKAGITHADGLVALSPSHAASLRDAQRGGAVAQILDDRSADLMGIVGGLDYAVYNPATDAALRTRYDAEEASNKGNTKTELIRALELELVVERPLAVAVVSGAEHIARFTGVAKSALEGDVALAVLVRPGVEIPDELSVAADGSEGRLRIQPAVGDVELRRGLGAADIALLLEDDSRDGFVARCAQRYGAVPVARATGAHVDVIVDCDAALETGTGFVYDEGSPDAMLGAFRRALAAYRSEAWPRLRRRVMKLDLGWDGPARRYLQMYRNAAKRLRGS